MSNLLQPLADPQQLARLRAMAALFGQGQQASQVSDETPTGPPLTPDGQTGNGSKPTPSQPGGSSQASNAQTRSLSTPGAISSAIANPQRPQASATATPVSSPTSSVITPAQGRPAPPTFSGPGAKQQPQTSLATPGAISKAMTGGGAPTSQPQPTFVDRFQQWEQSEPVAPKPEDFKTSIWRKLFGASVGFLQGLDNPKAGAETARELANPGYARAERNYQQTENRWERAGANLSKEGQLRELDERINASEAAARRAEDSRTLDQLYTDAVKAGDGARQAQVLDAIKGLEGAKRGQETPFAAWRQQNPTAPIESFFAAEKGAKEFTDPFQAFVYGTPEQQKAAKDFITFERQQGARFERPDEIQERYQLYRRDPDAYREMFGNRGTAQDQAQAARMLKYFDAQKARVTNDFTLSDDDKKQQLAEIENLEQPYLAAASVETPGAQGAPSPARNAGGNQNANRNAGGPGKDEVEVINPDGVRGFIPKANLAKALKRGYKQAAAQ